MNNLSALSPATRSSTWGRLFAPPSASSQRPFGYPPQSGFADRLRTPTQMTRAGYGGGSPQFGAYGGSLARGLAEPPGFRRNMQDEMRKLAGQAPPRAPSWMQRLAEVTGVPVAQSLHATQTDPRYRTTTPIMGTVPSVGSRNPSEASIQGISSQLLMDPTRVGAQFSSQLNLPNADESALSAWSAMRGQGGFSREAGLANANRGAYDPATGQYRTAIRIYDAIRDPNFNANGAQFGGATIAMDSRGRTFFTDRERGPDPGAAAREERRLAHMAQLAARGQAMPGDDRPEQLYLKQSALPPGTPSGASGYDPAALAAASERRAAMKATQDQRMGKVHGRAAQLADGRRARLEAQRNGPNLMDRLTARNPELAIRMMEGQQRERFFGQNLQAQERMAAMENDGRIAGIQAQVQNQMGIAQLDATTRQGIAAADLEFRKGAMEIDRALRERQISADEAKAAREDLAQQRRDVLAFAAAGMQAGAPVPVDTLNRLMPQGQPGFAQNSPWRFFNNPGAGQQEAPAAPQGPFADTPPPGVIGANQKLFAGGKLSQADIDRLRAIATANGGGEMQRAAIWPELAKLGITGQEAIAIANDVIFQTMANDYTPDRNGWWEAFLNKPKNAPGPRGKSPFNESLMDGSVFNSLRSITGQLPLGW